MEEDKIHALKDEVDKLKKTNADLRKNDSEIRRKNILLEQSVNVEQVKSAKYSKETKGLLLLFVFFNYF
jgi:FtsZ-binding cell division protein ZapB